MALSSERVDEIDGADVLTSDGQTVGTVEGIYFDERRREPKWAVVKTHWFAKGNTFVPVQDATFEEGTLKVPYDRDKLRGAPAVDPDRAPSGKEEAQLCSYYGLPYSYKAGLRVITYYNLFPGR